MAVGLISTLDVGVPRGINDSGQIVGSDGAVSFDEVSPGDFAAISYILSHSDEDPNAVTSANGINNLGEVVGAATALVIQEPQTEGFIYSGGTYTAVDYPSPQLSFPPQYDTELNAINDSDQLVGIFNESFGFIDSNGNFTTLADPLAQWITPTFQSATDPFGINDEGQVVGDYYNNNIPYGFLYSDGTYTTLTDPLGVYGTVARGINDSGQIVGYYIDANHVEHGFLYAGGQYYTIDPLGDGSAAYGINDQDQIVGIYLDSSNVMHGFLAGSVGPFANSDWGVAGVGDFNGDGMADLVWTNTADNLVELQFFNGATPVGGGVINNSPYDSSWSVAAVGDFNGDHHSDLVFHQAWTGSTQIALLSGTTIIGGGAIGNSPFGANWNIVATGDFNGDGDSDLVWQRPSDGLVEIQLIQAATGLGDLVETSGGGVIANNPFGAGWNIVGTGDFNGDGDSDLVWQNQSTGLVELQFLDGNNAVGGGAIANNPFGSGWDVVGSGDFLGNGFDDLVYQRQSDGLVEIQYLDGVNPQGGGVIVNNPFGQGWQVTGVGDFNGDGKADIVYHNASLNLTDVQFLNGTTPIGSGVMGALGDGTSSPQLLNVPGAPFV